MQTLETYINTTQTIDENDIFNIIFQIVHTLSIIREKYPNFNHNLLTIDKINLYLVKKNNKKTEYTYKNNIYKIQNSDFIIKLNNFHACNLESETTNDIKIFFNSSILEMILEDRNEVFIKSANRLIKSILKESFSNNFLRINVDQSGFTSVVLIAVAIANVLPLKSSVPKVVCKILVLSF